MKWWQIGRPDPAPRSVGVLHAVMVFVACLIVILGGAAVVDWMAK